MNFNFAFIVIISLSLWEEIFPNSFNMPLKDLGNRNKTLSLSSSPYCTASHGHLEYPLSYQELPNDKRENDKKKWNVGADRLKAKISPGISGYKREVSVLPREHRITLTYSNMRSDLSV